MTAVKAPKRNSRSLTALAGAVALTATSIGLWTVTASTAQAAALPTPDHVVVVVMENHAYSQVIGSSSAPYLNNTLKAGGANLTQSYGLTHPSEPNYYMLFSGSNQGRTDDSCVGVGSISAPNLASELIAMRQELEELQRVAAQPGFDDLQQRQLRAEAQPLVRLLQRADQHRDDLRAVPDRLHDPAQGLLRHPEPVQ